MPRSTTIAQEVIIEAAFELVRKEGFEVLSARNIAKQIGCSTQLIYLLVLQEYGRNQS